ncbi:MAG: TetR/AcrR family transcriptional regulator [Bryobacteraceae bacterium]
MAKIAAAEEVPLNKHQQKTEAMRRKLLKSARRIFARDGFQAARIEDIAADAGHTRGAFYAHFPAKEDLFLALLEYQARAHKERICRLLESCSSQDERLRCLREYYVSRLSDREWTMLTLEFKLFALRHGKLRARLAAAHRRIRASLNLQLIQDLLPERLRSDVHLHELRRLGLEAMLNGLVLERAYDPKRISEAEAVRLLGHAFDAMLGLDAS